ncbi:MAG: thioether cross-link-forming SCIFF peptide maturase [Bacillota bacterium]|nr:thioether cross-link-forming SCIFF peptide maturase [Bacillota bacterium]HHU62422.1 thioether cross-link-forming SCIFF peptide maturase [Natronincola sp.]
MLDKSCVHYFIQNDKHLVVDGNSAAVHVVDELAYELIKSIDENDNLHSIDKLRGFINKNPKFAEVGDEVLELIEANLLFSENLLTDIPRQESVVKALCLNVAHDCDLRCKYCFASTGDFGGARGLMPLEIAKEAVDFLIVNSGNRKQLDIDFFGGEPLLNWDVVKETVYYGLEQGALHGKTFRFTITTNGIGLKPEMDDFINEHMYNVVLSLDGRKEINDKVRQTVNNHGSVYEVVVPKFQRLVEKRGDKSYFVRGTFTSYNLDFTEDVLHLSDLGFKEISVEPVVTDPSEPYAIKEEHLTEVLAEYDRLADIYLERLKSSKPFNFYHFNVELTNGPCIYKRLLGCGAGHEYLAVAPNGDLYPCHQFVGDEEFKLGTIGQGVLNEDLPNEFKDNHVLNSEICNKCWAKFYCSGGCKKNNLEYAGKLTTPNELYCSTEKKRLECSFYIKASLC